MIDTWNPAVLNETTQDIDSWNPAELNQVTTKVDSWNPAILNKNLESTSPVVFSATITASFPEGATCTATNGTTTLTADNNPMAFNIPNEGTWAVACVANGVTFSENVVITTNGQTETVDLTPVGETVIPTDSVPMLIACAGIGDSTYTTISDVIADSDLLEEITTNDNTIAYLVRSTTFAATMVADEDTMAAIGASNGCSDALLSDSTWLNAICNSAYFNKVLNTSNPIMTSNTTPAGVCSGSTADSDAEYYKAFDNNFNNTWSSTSADSNAYIQYEFDTAITVNKLSMCPYITNRGNAVRQFVLSASNDGFVNDSHDLFTSPDYSNSTTAVFNFTINEAIQNSTAYKYYRVRVLSSYDTSNYKGIRELQFYGRQDV